MKILVVKSKRMKTAPVREICAITYPSPMDDVIQFAGMALSIADQTGGIASHRVTGNIQSFMLEGGR